MRTDPVPVGRPRSEQARTAVLHAVDDLLLEVGYAAMTMKGIAERAGVGRQTVYRWWSTKAEVLFEASVIDGRQELEVPPGDDPDADLGVYAETLHHFLVRSPAGTAYRALLGEAQQDPAVAALLRTQDVVADSARAVVDRAAGRGVRSADREAAVAALVGPVVVSALTGRRVSRAVTRGAAEAARAALRRQHS